MSNKQNAKYTFYYLLSLVALVFASLSVGMIAFGIIDKTVPDAIRMYSNADPQLKFAISALLIAAPTYYFMGLLIGRGLRRDELEKDSAVRRWLSYLIVLVAALFILGTFIGVINSFLSGELTSRFILKCATIFVIAGAVFSYYIYELRRSDAGKRNLISRLFFIVSLVLVVAAFVSAFFFVESPKVARARRLDNALVNNISSIESQVNAFYQQYDRLPKNLDEIRNDRSPYVNTDSFTDPETGALIEYKVTGDKSFEICATFRLDSDADRNANGSDYPSYAGYRHKAGYDCLKGNFWAVLKPESAVKAVPAK